MLLGPYYDKVRYLEVKKVPIDSDSYEVEINGVIFPLQTPEFKYITKNKESFMVETFLEETCGKDNIKRGCRASVLVRAKDLKPYSIGLLKWFGEKREL